MKAGRSITSSTPGRALTLFLALALVVTPALCCCFGAEGQAMAAAMPAAMDMEDCDDHGAPDPSFGDTSSAHHEMADASGADCHDSDCADCSNASAIDGVKADRFVAATPLHADAFVPVDDIETIIDPIAMRIVALYPRRGPPPLAPITLVSEHTLLLV